MMLTDIFCYDYSYESGVLENPNTEAPKDMYQMTTDPEKSPDETDVLSIDFENGKFHLIFL